MEEAPGATPAPAALPRRGVVARLKRGFGFIRSGASRLDVFFHFGSLEDPGVAEPGGPLAVGVDVEYEDGRDASTGRAQAARVRLLPPGAAGLERLSSGRLVGRVHEACGAGRGASGLLQYLADGGARVAYVPFRPADSAGASSAAAAAAVAALRPGDSVTFQLLEDVRAAEQAASAGHPRAAAIGRRAVGVAPLTEEGRMWLEQSERMELAMLEMQAEMQEAIREYGPPPPPPG